MSKLKISFAIADTNREGLYIELWQTEADGRIMVHSFDDEVLALNAAMDTLKDYEMAESIYEDCVPEGNCKVECNRPDAFHCPYKHCFPIQVRLLYKYHSLNWTVEKES